MNSIKLGLNIIDLEIVGEKFSRPFQLILMVYINYVLDQKKLKSAIRVRSYSQSYIYDSSRKIIECDFKGQVLKLLVPKSTSQKFKFVPTNPKFFNL